VPMLINLVSADTVAGKRARLHRHWACSSIGSAKRKAANDVNAVLLPWIIWQSRRSTALATDLANCMWRWPSCHKLQTIDPKQLVSGEGVVL
jgi:hypothetical protein